MTKTRGALPSLSFEFFPPHSPEASLRLWRSVERLAPLGPRFVSVTYGAGGTTRETTIEIVSHLKEDFGIEAMAHFTCVNATTDELRGTLDRMRDAGVENVLALRGDPPQGAERWTKTDGGLEFSRELVELISEEYPEFAVGGAAFPETHIHATSPADDIRYLKEKVDAGMQFVITQLFFDNAHYFDFVARAREAGVDVPIIPGVMPITSYDGIKRMTTLSAAELPASLERELAARKDDPRAIEDLGVSYATLQCAELLSGGAPGIHFITLNRSPATRAILAALRLTQPWRAADPV